MCNEDQWPERELREMPDALRWAMPRDFGGDDLDPVVHPPGVTRLGLDIGMLDKRGFDRHFCDNRRVREGALGIAFHNPSAHEDVVGMGLMQGRRLSAPCCGEPDRRKRSPPEGDLRLRDALDGGFRADDRQDRLTPEPYRPCRKYGLVLDRGIYAEPVVRHVLMGNNEVQPVTLPEFFEIAHFELRARLVLRGCDHRHAK